MVRLVMNLVKSSFDLLTIGFGRRTYSNAHLNTSSPGGLRGDSMSRIVDCPCGISLSGSGDEELFRLGREHADVHHPDDGITDDLVRGHIDQNAGDAAA